MDSFFVTLKEKRKEKFTQEAFAKALNISDTQVQNYEKDTYPPHEKLLEINRLLGYDFSRHIYQEKFGNEVEPIEHLLEDLQSLVEKYKTSSGEPQKTTQHPPQVRDERKKVSRFEKTSADKSKVRGRRP